MKTEAVNRSTTEVLINSFQPNSGWAARARRTVLLCLSPVLALFIVHGSVLAREAGGQKSFTCYQANAYIGTFYEGVLAVDPNNVTQVLATVTQIYGEILASDPPLRMAALADEIATAQPDIAGLEEVWTLEQAPATLQGPGEFTVVYDYLQLLTNALAAKGAHYQVAVMTTESDYAMPMLDLQTGELAYGRIVDHEVILVRTDLPPGYLRVANPQTGRYTNLLQFPSLGITSERGWCSVDVFTRGERFRFICTHLEDEMAPPIQEAQGLELLAGPANVTGPVLIVGDFNADPLNRTGTTTYHSLTAAGFKDAWQALNPNNPAGGLTWGHDPDLAMPALSFVTRIDFVLYRGGQFIPRTATILDPRISLAQPPLWPSDHAALAASFWLKNPESLKAISRH